MPVNEPVTEPVKDPVNDPVLICLELLTVPDGSSAVTCVELETIPDGVPVKLAYGKVPVCVPANEPVNDPVLICVELDTMPLGTFEILVYEICVELDTNVGLLSTLANVTYDAESAEPANLPFNVVAYNSLTHAFPSTPNPPLITNAPDPLETAAVVLVIVKALLVIAPKSVTSWKS